MVDHVSHRSHPSWLPHRRCPRRRRCPRSGVGLACGSRLRPVAAHPQADPARLLHGLRLQRRAAVELGRPEGLPHAPVPAVRAQPLADATDQQGDVRPPRVRRRAGDAEDRERRPVPDVRGPAAPAAPRGHGRRRVHGQRTELLRHAAGAVRVRHRVDAGCRRHGALERRASARRACLARPGARRGLDPGHRPRRPLRLGHHELRPRAVGPSRSRRRSTTRSSPGG